MLGMNERLDLSPARWIWLPSERTLANTFVLFRKEVRIDRGLVSASGWILADSRYRLTVNGRRVQWGPAPSDPRWPDADPMQLAKYLVEGENVIGIEVLYYGHGDGTWVTGKPGLLFKLDLAYEDGTSLRVVSDGSWRCMADRAHRPGQYKRWYLRSLQEEFDARLHPYGWDRPDFDGASEWHDGMELDTVADQPSIMSGYSDYLFDSGVMNGQGCGIGARTIPLLEEQVVLAKRLVGCGRATWTKPPEEWFDFRTPGIFRIDRGEYARRIDEKRAWRLPEPGEGQAHVLTYEWEEQLVGFPFFTIEAPAGTIVEVMTQEAHDPERVDWLDTHKFSWSRFICKEGLNRFECYDYESLRWLQLHIRNHNRPITVSEVGVRRRLYPWANQERVICADLELQRLFDACLNTIRNNAMETIVDGMGRERQQYSGDIGHELHAIRYVYGDAALPERFLRTYSQGITLEGYFMDCWPAYDRMVRFAQRQVGLTPWGPILDHSVQFVFDNWNHYMETGRKDALLETYPRLKRFVRYLERLRQEDGLIPVEGIGVPTVWVDHEAYLQQRHKQCAFNLYVAGMLREAMVPLARLFGDEDDAVRYVEFASGILSRVIERFWHKDLGLFVNNLPWLSEEPTIRYCDRSLSMAILYGLCPEGIVEPSRRVLAECPDQLGLSYPPNAGWRHRALAKMGEVDVMLGEWRDRWSRMPSVLKNNTMSEFWEARPDCDSQWSHASVAPLYVLMMDVAGLQPVEPGFQTCRLRPRLGNIPSLELNLYTPLGPVHFRSELAKNGQRIRVRAPKAMAVTMDVLDADTLDLTYYEGYESQTEESV